MLAAAVCEVVKATISDASRASGDKRSRGVRRSSPSRTGDGGSHQVERTGCISDGLRGLTVRAQEASAHAFSITEPIGACDSFHGQPPLFEHETSCLQTQVFDC